MFNLILLIATIIIAYKLYMKIATFGCKCKNCGKNIDCNSSRCQYCGTPLNENYSTNSKYSYDSVYDDLDGITISLMAKVAKDDGYISPEESNYIYQRFEELLTLTHKDKSVLDIYKQIFELEKDRLDNLEQRARELSNLNIDAKRYVFNLLKELAKFDKKFNVLDKIKIYIDFEEENQEESDYYKILESSPDDDLETIKKNYRRLAKEYHYDSLASKHLPKDMLDYANQKLQKINEAWEWVKNNYKNVN